MASVNMLPGQSMNLSIQAVDANGAAVALPAGSTVTYQSNNPSCVAVTANADGVTAVAKAVATGPVDQTCTIEGILNFRDGGGSKQFLTPLLTVTVTFPVSAIASVTMSNSAPA